MKRVFLVMVVSAMLVTLGFAQTPDTSSDSDLAAVKGCLGGSEGNYTVVQDGTGQTFPDHQQQYRSQGSSRP